MLGTVGSYKATIAWADAVCVRTSSYGIVPRYIDAWELSRNGSRADSSGPWPATMSLAPVDSQAASKSRSPRSFAIMPP